MRNSPERFPTEEHGTLDLNRVITVLDGALPDIAASLIATNHDMEQPYEKSFRDHPDDPREHTPRWHQYGILTHSEKFHEALVNVAPRLLEQWQLGG